MRSDPEQVLAVAGQFRAAIEQLDGDFRLYGLRRFPRGSCGDASRLLSQFFIEQGLGEWNLISGSTPGSAAFLSHAWLELDGLIVDITADQFAEVANPVIVSRTSPWHSRWNGRVADRGVTLAHYSDDSGAKDDYASIVSRFEAMASS